MDLSRNFLKGVTDKDSDERLLQEGMARDFFNVRVLSSENGNVGSIETCLGNEALTDLDIGNNAITIGSGKSESLNTIYWLVKSDSGTSFIEFNTITNSVKTILKDTRIGEDRVLNLKEEFLVHNIIIIIDSENETAYACWTDNNDPIRFVNIERAKEYGENGFGQDDITLIKKPPKNKPKLTLINNPSNSDENNLSEKFLSFAYRYKYLDGEYSALSPFTTAAFFPKTFDYNFYTNSNESMVNSINEILLELNTGSHLVTEIELVFKESNSNTIYRSSPYNKKDKGWGDYQIVEVSFDNNKIHRILPESELKRLYDGIPDKAFSAAYIGGRLMFGNYTENKDLITNDGTEVVVDLELEHKYTENLVTGQPYRTVKSIRDYEVGIVYKDDYGRMTSVLTSDGNTVFIPIEFSQHKNSLALTIKHKAPVFAKSYQLFIKQSKTHYDTIVSTLFYRENQYGWVLLQSGEGDKIKEGDYLIVKSDSQGTINKYVETKVIEIKQQPVNFLTQEDTDIPMQIAGTYFKIEPSNFRMTESDYKRYNYWSKGVDGSAVIINRMSYIDKPVYYGTNGINDLTAHGIYTEDSRDIRFQIEIDGTSGASDTFRWSSDNGLNWTSGVVITGGQQPLQYGVRISFSSTTGHSIDDKWIVPARGKDGDGYGAAGAGFGAHQDTRGYAFLTGPIEGNVSGDSETILPGAKINIFYGEYGRVNFEETQSFTSPKRYDNIEEWWIDNSVEEKFSFVFNHFWFRRGFSELGPDDRTRFEENTDGFVHLAVRAAQARTQSHSSIIVMKIEIIQSDHVMMFETKSLEENSDIFYEIGETYPISSDGYHLGLSENGDVSQDSTTHAKINLDWFNSFGWGNGFESYKIKDDLNGKDLGIGTRGHGVLDNYKKNIRSSSITWGDIFEQSNGYNGLNVFNLSTFNHIDLDNHYGAIKYLYSRESNLVAIQESRIQPLGYQKTEFIDQAGNPTIVSSDKVLSMLAPYAGEYGISDHPESFASDGNRLYFVDSRRGTPIRLSNNGVTELSMYGYKSFFKEMFRKFPDAKYHGGFDPYFDEYILTIYLSVNGDIFPHSIGFSDTSKGWTSRYGFFPEGLIGLSNNFYTLKNGQLYKHNSKNVPRNYFYGEQFSSVIELIFNDSPSEDKIFKSLNIEGTHPWDIRVETNLTEGTINKEEFENRESRWFAYTRRNERVGDMTSLSTIGLGNIVFIEANNKLRFAGTLNYITAGDIIYQLVDNESQYLGEVLMISGNTIEIKQVIESQSSPSLGAYCYAVKDSRIQGGAIRGYYMKVRLETEETDFVELFSVGTKIAKSYV